jgi:hypothetical protein
MHRLIDWGAQHAFLMNEVLNMIINIETFVS